jgi:hypothetical protein
VKERHWDFGYEPRAASYHELPPATELNVVVATPAPLDEATLRRALGDIGAAADVEILIARDPLFWCRVRGPAPVPPDTVAASLAAAGVEVRYVASAQFGSLMAGPALDLDQAPVAEPDGWLMQPARPIAAVSSEGHWFLGHAGGGLRVDRRICGTGAGGRLAVIDDDAADLDQTDVDRLIHVGTSQTTAASGHGALMVAWATTARRPDGARFEGVAPDASCRLYAIPKAGLDVVSLPLAIARAVFDGADVVVCATYAEGTTSPMLDDALDVAAHLGRGGRGSVVVLPTGRETASAGSSLHASLSLEFGDPASDPRVHCVAPGGRQGGWFLWRSPRGLIRPFANRGPAVRWLAPGDDLAYPFSSRDRSFHAESSGASAVAAGVMLLLLGSNPDLSLRDVHAVLERSVDRPDDIALLDRRLADAADILPSGVDRDGHDAKCGYGRLNATRACAIAADPVALGLMATGEDALAIAWRLSPQRPFSERLARWAARVLLFRPELEHAMRAVLRHLRLVSTDPSRAKAHAPGALARHLALLVRELKRLQPPPAVFEELETLAAKLRAATSPLHAPSLEGLAQAAMATLAAELPTPTAQSAFSTASVQS